jgi:SnoaL-like domain
MTLSDQQACAELIQAWGLYRDQGRWAELRATFVPEGEIAVSWFRGPFADFVERCKQIAAAGTSRAKHLLWPSVVHVSADRAVAETSVAILVRQSIDGVLVDLTSYGRFLDRLERRGRWLIVERATIYEQDRLDPVQPSEEFVAMMKKADVGKFPAAYRYMDVRSRCRSIATGPRRRRHFTRATMPGAKVADTRIDKRGGGHDWDVRT